MPRFLVSGVGNRKRESCMQIEWMTLWMRSCMLCNWSDEPGLCLARLSWVTDESIYSSCSRPGNRILPSGRVCAQLIMLLLPMSKSILADHYCGPGHKDVGHVLSEFRLHSVPSDRPSVRRFVVLKANDLFGSDELNSVAMAYRIGRKQSCSYTGIIPGVRSHRDNKACSLWPVTKCHCIESVSIVNACTCAPCKW